MKKQLSLLLIGSFLLLASLSHANGVSVVLTPKFDKYKYPEGPNPNNPFHLTYFNFDVSITGLEDNAYYYISADLTSTEYKGTMANYGVRTDKDLKFNKSDYMNSAWVYSSESFLYKWVDSVDRTVPTSVKIRCYDYGPKGTLTITVRKNYMLASGYSVSHSVPFDKNGNGILDGWQYDDMIGHYDDNGDWVSGFDPEEDEESFTGNTHNGDGWSATDEFRGLWGGYSHFRLDPYNKDVIFTSTSELHEYGTGDYYIPKHNVHTVTSKSVMNAYGQVYTIGGDDILPDDQVSETTGLVNPNSEGVIPGGENVWAIRATTRGGDSPTDEDGNSYLGMVVYGSPSK